MIEAIIYDVAAFIWAEENPLEVSNGDVFEDFTEAFQRDYIARGAKIVEMVRAHDAKQ